MAGNPKQTGFNSCCGIQPTVADGNFERRLSWRNRGRARLLPSQNDSDWRLAIGERRMASSEGDF